MRSLLVENDRSVAASALVGLAVLASAFAVVSVSARYREYAESLEDHAADYLELVAALRTHDPVSVDFHNAEKGQPRPLEVIAVQGRSLALHIRQSHLPGNDSQKRADALAAQLDAVAARASMLSGSRMTFDAEMRQLFATDEPVALPESGADDRARLEHLLTGDEPLSRKLASYLRRFDVPRARLHAAITRSLELCRDQTRQFLPLPPGESLTVEYVADEPWSGFSFYRGQYRSVMQVNRALPFAVSDVLTLACHEGYPGHHVYNSLREQHLQRERGWTELSALPLFSPAGFRAEAVTSAAASMAFTTKERARIFRDILFPLAGLDPREAARYAEVHELVDRIAGEAAPILRGYLAGDLHRDRAADSLRALALMEHPDALFGYVDRYRGYALAYNMGRDHFLSALEGAGGRPEQWDLLRRFILGTTAP